MIMDRFVIHLDASLGKHYLIKKAFISQAVVTCVKKRYTYQLSSAIFLELILFYTKRHTHELVKRKNKIFRENSRR
jgi:hypothetical protein